MYSKLTDTAPGIEPDVDDSAKASVTLSLLGRPGLTSTILKEFGTKGHFKTYGSEKDASVSANCNVLMAMLLDTVVNPGSIDAIETTARFLCDKWFQTSGLLKDKWVSPVSHRLIFLSHFCSNETFFRMSPVTIRPCS